MSSSTYLFDNGFVRLDVTPSKVLISSLAISITFLLYLIFVPPRKLYANDNGVKVIRNRFPGLGGIGFYANRYQ